MYTDEELKSERVRDFVQKASAS